MTQTLGFVSVLRTVKNTWRLAEVRKALTNSMIKSEGVSSVRNAG